MTRSTSKVHRHHVGIVATRRVVGMMLVLAGHVVRGHPEWITLSMSLRASNHHDSHLRRHRGGGHGLWVRAQPDAAETTDELTMEEVIEKEEGPPPIVVEVADPMAVVETDVDDHESSSDGAEDVVMNDIEVDYQSTSDVAEYKEELETASEPGTVAKEEAHNDEEFNPVDETTVIPDEPIQTESPYSPTNEHLSPVSKILPIDRWMTDDVSSDESLMDSDRMVVLHLTDATFEHETQASTGRTTGSWLVWFYEGDDSLDDNNSEPSIRSEWVGSLPPDQTFWTEEHVVVAKVDVLESPMTTRRFFGSDNYVGDAQQRYPALLLIHNKHGLFHFTHTQTATTWSWDAIVPFIAVAQAGKITGEVIPPPLSFVHTLLLHILPMEVVEKIDEEELPMFVGIAVSAVVVALLLLSFLFGFLTTSPSKKKKD